MEIDAESAAYTETESQSTVCTDAAPPALLTQYAYRRDGGLTGLCFRDGGGGQSFQTSPVRTTAHSEEGETIVTTASGHVYRLGEPAEQPRRMARSSSGAKPSPLDDIDVTGLQAALAPHSLRFALSEEANATAAAASLIESSFAIDSGDGAFNLQGLRAAARRAVLLKDGIAVAAAVLEAHAGNDTLEIVLIATEKRSRLQVPRRGSNAWTLQRSAPPAPRSACSSLRLLLAPPAPCSDSSDV